MFMVLSFLRHYIANCIDVFEMLDISNIFHIFH